jgi:type I restriction enzyme R subunit
VDPPFPGESGVKERRARYVVDNVAVRVVAERVQYYGPDGKLITESLRDFTRHRVKQQFISLDAFLRRWNDADQKRVLIEELATRGVLWEELAGEVEKKLGQPLDPFDLICHVAFDQPPLSRRDRAAKVRKRNYFAKYQGTARQVLEGLLDKYADSGVEHIEDVKILQLDPFRKLGSPVELIGVFGGKGAYLSAVSDLENELYG